VTRARVCRLKKKTQHGAQKRDDRQVARYARAGTMALERHIPLWRTSGRVNFIRASYTGALVERSDADKKAMEEVAEWAGDKEERERGEARGVLSHLPTGARLS